MKRQQAKEFLPIIKAFAEGKTIQYYYGADWIDISPDGAVDFSDNPSNYRIKPEPDKNQLPIKDGDIMMTMGKRAFIANGIIDSNGRPCAHCGINLHHDFTIGTTMCGWTSSPYIPASEEAKKELFIKMGIAGYTWNAKTLKLEKIEPKYRPFRTKEECWNEMLKHQPFGWVKHTSSNEYFYSILEVIDGGCVFVYGPMVPFDEVYEFNTFADGTPFGIKERIKEYENKRVQDTNTRRL